MSDSIYSTSWKTKEFQHQMPSDIVCSYTTLSFEYWAHKRDTNTNILIFFGGLRHYIMGVPDPFHDTGVRDPFFFVGKNANHVMKRVWNLPFKSISLTINMR